MTKLVKLAPYDNLLLVCVGLCCGHHIENKLASAASNELQHLMMQCQFVHLFCFCVFVCLYTFEHILHAGMQLSFFFYRE